MKTRVEVSQQVAQFVRTIAPQPRQTLRVALRLLAQGKGDIKALEGELQGFMRLRVGRHRIIFHYELAGDERVLRCDYAEQRSLIYETFSETLVERIRQGGRAP